MDIKSLAELAKIINLCRKNGIETFKVTSEGVEFRLKENLPERKRRRRGQEVSESQSAETEEAKPLTEEELLLWSSPGIGEMAQGGH